MATILDYIIIIVAFIICAGIFGYTMPFFTTYSKKAKWRKDFLVITQIIFMGCIIFGMVKLIYFLQILGVLTPELFAKNINVKKEHIVYVIFGIIILIWLSLASYLKSIFPYVFFYLFPKIRFITQRIFSEDLRKKIGYSILKT